MSRPEVDVQASGAAAAGDGLGAPPPRSPMCCVASRCSRAPCLSRLIGFVVLAMVAARWGPARSARSACALAIASYVVAIPSDFGIATLTIRDIARAPGAARDVAGEALCLQALLTALSSSRWWCWRRSSPTRPSPHSPARVRAVLVVYVLTWDSAFQAVQRMSAVALVRLAGQVVFGAVTPLILVNGLAGAQRYAWMTVVSERDGGTVACPRHPALRPPRPRAPGRWSRASGAQCPSASPW